MYARQSCASRLGLELVALFCEIMKALGNVYFLAGKNWSASMCIEGCVYFKYFF